MSVQIASRFGGAARTAGQHKLKIMPTEIIRWADVLFKIVLFDVVVNLLNRIKERTN